MIKNNLIICGNCESQGTRQILGELKENAVKVLRFHNGFTTILGNDFQVACGNCNEIVYIRKEANEGTQLSNGSTGFLGVITYSETRISGTPGI